MAPLIICWATELPSRAVRLTVTSPMPAEKGTSWSGSVNDTGAGVCPQVGTASVVESADIPSEVSARLTSTSTFTGVVVVQEIVPVSTAPPLTFTSPEEFKTRDTFKGGRGAMFGSKLRGVAAAASSKLVTAARSQPGAWAQSTSPADPSPSTVVRIRATPKVAEKVPWGPGKTVWAMSVSQS